MARESITVRTSALADWNAIADIWTAAQDARRGNVGVSKPVNIVGLRDRVEAEHPWIFIAEADGKPVGTAMAFLARVQDETKAVVPGVVHISVVGVLPEMWGRGIASLTMTSLLKAMRGKFNQAQLGTQVTNVRAHDLYTRLGFTATATYSRDPNGEEIRRYVIDIRPPVQDANIMLRKAVAADDAFIREVYFTTQRWITERLFGWRCDEFEDKKFDESYALSQIELIVVNQLRVGWIAVLEDDSCIDLAGIYIVPGYQNNGVGTLLIERLIKHAREANKSCILSTAKINPARRLYTRLGFKEIPGENEFKVYFRHE